MAIGIPASRPPIAFAWGALFENILNLNDGVRYNGATYDTRSGVEMDIQLQEQANSHPYVERIKPRERVFSVKVQLMAEPFTPAGEQLEVEMKTALYSGMLRMYVQRGTVNDTDGNPTRVLHYLECYCEQVKDVGPGVFEILFKAPNPFFILEAGTVTYRQPLHLVGLGTAPESGQYLPINLTYTGSAPSEPYIIFTIGGRGGVYQYYREISITNNSPNAWHDQPICFDLGDLRAAVTAGKFHEIGANSLGVDTHSLKDIRIESQGGARKQFWIRDSGMRGGTWHQSVKLWTVIHGLAPGETKILRILYGNPNAPAEEIYPEQGQNKCMFTMYDSNNDAWTWSDFAPAWNQPQTRLMQWYPYIPERRNIAWIAHRHDGFDNLTGEANINVAGAKCTMYAPGAGATGMQISLATGVESITYTGRVSTNAKAPLVMRWQHRNLEWEDPYELVYSDSTSTARTRLTSVAPAGATVLGVESTTIRSGIEYFHVDQELLVRFTDGTAQRFDITAVTPTTISISPAIPAGKSAASGSFVQAVVSNGFTKNFNTTTKDYPLVIAFAMRVDQPTLTLGDWYFGGAEVVTITFADNEKPTVTAWASAAEVDITVGKFQLKGKFGNPATDEWLGINYITHNIFDRVIVDCQTHFVWYEEWDPVAHAYKPLVDIYEALRRVGTVRWYWLHLEPARLNQLLFIHDPDSNFRSTDVYIEYQTLFY